MLPTHELWLQRKEKEDTPSNPQQKEWIALTKSNQKLLVSFALR